MSLPRRTPFIPPVPASERAARLVGSSRPDVAWTVVGEVGALLAVVGVIDLALAWYPLSFGNPEWEFGTVTTTLDGLPATAIGLGMVLAAALFLEKRLLGRVVAGLLGLLGLLILAMGLMYVTTLPMAWASVNEPVLQEGLLKAITKTLVQALLYPAVFIGVALQGWRNTAAVSIPRAD